MINKIDNISLIQDFFPILNVNILFKSIYWDNFFIEIDEYLIIPIYFNLSGNIHPKM